ncbi:MAG TPA: polysaccharide ABC transporter ATP-binding protein [Xanthomonadaceae bacterium]|nr:polysaccharide ABC transporter ATP-binding protein [Xanthomonadaceae bacterium]
MSAPLLEVSGLGKSYPAAADARARSLDFLRALLGRPIARHPVLADVSFAVPRGQSLGIIGENGAGKSTLLKLVCGVLHPTAGTVRRNGNVGALLELGAGFDPERSGAENIALAAGLMGLSAAQIRERRDQIVAFADIGRYLTEPVKHYSSGMTVRLGFAIVASCRPDLLITDEVLAVGDESFQKKCVRWIEDYLDEGGTLLLVSHSMYHVQKLCRQALWLRQGRVEACGDVFDVTQDYLAYHERKSARPLDTVSAVAAVDSGEYRIGRVSFDGEPGRSSVILAEGATLRIQVDLLCPDGRAAQFGIGVVRADGTPVYGTTSEIDAVPAQRIDERTVRYSLALGPLPLLPGSYTLRLHATDPEALRLFDTVEVELTVRGATREFGLVRLPHRWGGG